MPGFALRFRCTLSARTTLTVHDLPDPLEALVERTRGLQPWRKAFHAVNGLLVAGALATVDLPRSMAAALLAAIAATLLVSDIVRLRHPRSNALFFTAFSRLASPREAEGMASSTWYALGLAITVALAPTEVAVTAILVLGLADPAASLVGQRWGRRPFMGGTREGTLVFFVVAFAIVGWRHGWAVALPVGAATALAERKSWPLDDNLTIAVVCAAGILAAQSLLGGP